jgi:hypothetical protein
MECVPCSCRCELASFESAGGDQHFEYLEVFRWDVVLKAEDLSDVRELAGFWYKEFCRFGELPG